MAIANPEPNGKPPITDEELVRRSLTGGREAFAALYDRYARLVRVICFEQLGRRLECAEDLAQEVFLRAYQKLERLRDPVRFSSWLIGISRTACKEWRRKHGRDRLEFGGLDVAEPVAASNADNRTEVEELRHAMSALSESERIALHLHYLQQRPAEVARTLFGLSRSGYYRLLERARSRLRKLLREREDIQP